MTPTARTGTTNIKRKEVITAAKAKRPALKKEAPADLEEKEVDIMLMLLRMELMPSRWTEATVKSILNEAWKSQHERGGFFSRGGPLGGAQGGARGTVRAEIPKKRGKSRGPGGWGGASGRAAGRKLGPARGVARSTRPGKKKFIIPKWGKSSPLSQKKSPFAGSPFAQHRGQGAAKKNRNFL